MKTIKFIPVIALIFLLAGCAQERRPKDEAKTSTQNQEKSSRKEETFKSPQAENAAASAQDGTDKEAQDLIKKDSDTQSNAFMPSSVAVVSKDTTRKFIITGDIKFKAKNVIKATYNIEDITHKEGGFVTSTTLASDINSVTTTPVSVDSSMVTTFYTVSNTLILRIPNYKLDTALKQIAKNIDYLDHRNLKKEDVALRLLANKLAQKRADKTQQRLASAIDKKGQKLDDIVSAEEILSNKEEQSDNAKLSNMSINDQIAYSTVSLIVYQPPTVKREMIFNHKSIEPFEPSFGSKMVDAMQFGWQIIKEIFLVFLKFWTLILLAVGGFFLYRKYKKQTK